VLEPGAGTGRVTLAIAAAGVPVHALDASEAMISALQAKLAAQPSGARRTCSGHQALQVLTE
jgi:2-polyprenyl-3-methyl-5-hydroxy-6-metoxy-1,4-benzoquinol methylase